MMDEMQTIILENNEFDSQEKTKKLLPSPASSVKNVSDVTILA